MRRAQAIEHPRQHRGGLLLQLGQLRRDVTRRGGLFTANVPAGVRCAGRPGVRPVGGLQLICGRRVGLVRAFDVRLIRGPRVRLICGPGIAPVGGLGLDLVSGLGLRLGSGLGLGGGGGLGLGLGIARRLVRRRQPLVGLRTLRRSGGTTATEEPREQAPARFSLRGGRGRRLAGGRWWLVRRSLAARRAAGGGSVGGGWWLGGGGGRGGSVAAGGGSAAAAGGSAMGGCGSAMGGWDSTMGGSGCMAGAVRVAVRVTFVPQPEASI